MCLSMNMMSENNQKSKIGEKQHYLEELEIKKIKEDEEKRIRNCSNILDLFISRK